VPEPEAAAEPQKQVAVNRARMMPRDASPKRAPLRLHLLRCTANVNGIGSELVRELRR